MPEAPRLDGEVDAEVELPICVVLDAEGMPQELSIQFEAIMSFDDGRNVVYLIVQKFINGEPLVRGVADGQEVGCITNRKGDATNRIWVGHRPICPVSRQTPKMQVRIERAATSMAGLRKGLYSQARRRACVRTKKNDRRAPLARS